MDLTPLERAVIDTLLSRHEPGYAELREQFTSCRVNSRKMTDVGFYTELGVDAHASSAPVSVGNPLGQGYEFPDGVYADIDGLEHGAGFLLWLDEGRLETLEAFTYAEPWPDEVRRFEVRFEPINRSA